jgi:hypothetical protein
MWKQASFHMDYALYWLNMVGIEMAHLKYLSLDIFLDILTILIGFHM